MAIKYIDEMLINSLIGDGRASLRNLAEELDVSVTTISNHLKDLESEGNIQGYSPIVDYNSLGYDVTAIMHLKVEGSALPQITNRLEAEKQMISVYETTGDYDIIAIGKFHDTDSQDTGSPSLINSA